MTDKRYCGKAEDPEAAALLAAAETPSDSREAHSDDDYQSTHLNEVICKMPMGGGKFVELRNGDKSVMVSMQRFFDENNYTCKGFVGTTAHIDHRKSGETAGDFEFLAIRFANLCCAQAHDLRYQDDGHGRFINVGSNRIEVSAEARAKSRLLQALSIYEKCRLTPEACFQLALCYEHGTGVRKSILRAKELYQDAFERGLSLTSAAVYDVGTKRSLQHVSCGTCCLCYYQHSHPYACLLLSTRLFEEM